jgi:F-type H+-transporting ATPase subunit gamma
MAKARAIKKRIKAVKNTRKITKTMGMVATAKSKKALDRLKETEKYRQGLFGIIHSLIQAGEDLSHPLLEKKDFEKNIDLLIITADRGLCGGYNSNILKIAGSYIEEKEKEGKKVNIFVVGRKGISYFDFKGVSLAGRITGIGDNPVFEKVKEIGDSFISRFLDGESDRVDVVYTHYYSQGRQRAIIRSLMPLDVHIKEEYINILPVYSFSPNKKDILDRLLIDVIRNELFGMMLSAVLSEQIARRIAMKVATDAADEMIKMLTRFYNRARQTQITQEIAEIVRAIDAIK